MLNFIQMVADFLATTTTPDITNGLVAIGAGIAALSGMGNALGEARVCATTIEAMMRSPEQAPQLRSTMILSVALVETTGIYALLIAILSIFFLGN